MMTPASFTEALATIGWSRRHLAKELGCDASILTRWERGRVAIPEALGGWLQGMASYHRRHPAPAWRTYRRAGLARLED